jgi:ABC transporter with metal-binding/Fe-S-binding domain ATP-binding protein
MIAALFSGGKDSTLAVHRMHDQGRDVDLLISMESENDFSYMFHKPNIKWTGLQADAMEIKHVFFNTKGEKEKELEDLETALVENWVTELVTGAVASAYQRDRINTLCQKLGIVHHAPLWGIDPLTELKELARDFDVIVAQVSAQGFDDNILGKRLDDKMIERLVALNKKYKINMSFEGGEAESFVLDAPMFKKKIVIQKARTEWKGNVGRYIIEQAKLEPK